MTGFYPDEVLQQIFKFLYSNDGIVTKTNNDLSGFLRHHLPGDADNGEWASRVSDLSICAQGISVKY